MMFDVVYQDENKEFPLPDTYTSPYLTLEYLRYVVSILYAPWIENKNIFHSLVNYNHYLSSIYLRSGYLEKKKITRLKVIFLNPLYKKIYIYFYIEYKIYWRCNLFIWIYFLVFYLWDNETRWFLVIILLWIVRIVWVSTLTQATWK